MNDVADDEDVPANVLRGRDVWNIYRNVRAMLIESTRSMQRSDNDSTIELVGPTREVSIHRTCTTRCRELLAVLTYTRCYTLLLIPGGESALVAEEDDDDSFRTHREHLVIYVNEL